MNRRTDSPSVHITNLHPKIRISNSKISTLTRKVFRLLKLDYELHITFVNDRDMQRMNKLFHGTNAPTDVLAFEQPTNWSQRIIPGRFLGEILISIDRANIYAKRFHVKLDEELFRYVVHGLLHLLGERDHTPKLKKKMFARQEMLLKKIGFIPKLTQSR